jgi:hypothetical protein
VRGQLLRLVQRRLQHFYALEGVPDVLDFVREVDDAARETLLVRESEDGIELALLLPKRLLEPGAPQGDADGLLQAFEGVSHFVYLAERVRTGLPTTRLELELQAEVDKFVLLAVEGEGLPASARGALCQRLFEHVRFLHDAASEDGQRYRLANALAARYVRRLDPHGEPAALRRQLGCFYRAGQTDKIRMARAA